MERKLHVNLVGYLQYCYVLLGNTNCGMGGRKEDRLCFKGCILSSCILPSASQTLFLDKTNTHKTIINLCRNGIDVNREERERERERLILIFLLALKVDTSSTYIHVDKYLQP